MGEPKKKPPPDEPRLGPPAEAREEFADASLDEPLDVDPEAYLHWLETGEDDSCPDSSS